MLKFFKKKEGEKGFTLIELMIVVAIIGILAAIAIPQFQLYRRRGWVATINSDGKNAFTASAAVLADDPNVTSIDCGDLNNAGFVQSSGVSCSMAFTSMSNYTISVSGNTAWGLSQNTAVVDQNGEFTQKAAI